MTLVLITISLLITAATFWPIDRNGAVILDDLGVRRLDPEEEIRWEDLHRVDILTTADGPFQNDVFFLLQAQDGTGCAVPLDDACAIGLLERLQELPGFDNQMVIEAMGSTTEAVFPCWIAHSEKNGGHA